MSSFDVASILGQHLSALDDDVRDYLVSVVEDMSADERKSGAALNEAIGPFLLDGGSVESEEAAEILCKTISISFGGSGFKSAIVVEEEQVSLLSAPIKMIDRSGLSKTPKATYGGTVISTFDDDGQLVEVNHNTTLDASVIATTQRQVRRNRKENDRLNKILRGEELARMNAEAEMSAARMAAIKANRTAGRQASMGVNIERFSIPHPSGSSDLLTDASLTLASGHRYGMVGKNGAGKSTLMRQLANYKLEGLMHLRILLVDQHVEGDDQSALQWVLRADVERTALLEDEKRLIECQHDSSVIPRDLRVSTSNFSTYLYQICYVVALGLTFSALLFHLGCQPGAGFGRVLRAYGGYWGKYGGVPCPQDPHGPGLLRRHDGESYWRALWR